MYRAPAGNSMDDPVVSFVIPARNEAGYIGSTLESIAALDRTPPHETIVVDGGSTDATPDIAREFGVRCVEGDGGGQGNGRHLGACRADGEWLTFLDADTRVRPGYVGAMLSFVERRDLAGGGSRCRVRGGWRTRPYERLFNDVLPRLSPPVLPGFHVFVRRDAYFDVGGFASGPNEDVTFSRRLGRRYRTGVCPRVLVETSGRRIEERGLVQTTAYYTWKELRRQRALRYQGLFRQ